VSLNDPAAHEPAGLPRTAWLRVDLGALAHNLAALRRLAGPGVRVQPVVKADAYGHGAVPVARALISAGADGLCVAALDEALELRRAGLRRAILVLYGVPPALAPLAARRRIAVSAGDTTLVERTLAALAAADPGTRLDVHLEVETGLGRDGLSGAALVSAAARLAASSSVRLSGAWTHLQAAEDAATTARQVALFEAETAALRRAGVRLPGRHLAASGGLLSGGLATYDAVRPGLAVYGLVPDELLDRLAPDGGIGLRPVLSLHARPVRVADLAAGHGVGYGPSFVTQRPSRIATLPLGYGDGWSRAWSNRAEALVRGRRAPIVGNISMDALTVDVTDVPGPPVGLDDEFVLLGTQGRASISAADLARARTTNSWEVVTAMSRRLPRVYDAGSGQPTVRTLVTTGAG
jgi:alanine racemase